MLLPSSRVCLCPLLTRFLLVKPQSSPRSIILRTFEKQAQHVGTSFTNLHLPTVSKRLCNTKARTCPSSTCPYTAVSPHHCMHPMLMRTMHAAMLSCLAGLQSHVPPHLHFAHMHANPRVQMALLLVRLYMWMHCRGYRHACVGVLHAACISQ